MRLQVSAGFSQPLDPTVGGRVRYVGRGVRTGPANNDEHPWVETIVRDAMEYGTEGTFIVGGWDWRDADGSVHQERDRNLEPMKDHLGNQCVSILNVWAQAGGEPEDCTIEIGNELDGSYWKKDLAAFWRTAMHCYRRVREISATAPFITGSTMNFNKEPAWKRGGYETLDALCRFGWPADTIQGLHPYRSNRARAWPSFSSDAEALDALRKVLRGRPVAITEMGWPSGIGHTDMGIARMVGEELQMWEDFGATHYVHYQIQDAPQPGNTGEGGFGAFTNALDGLNPKSVSGTLHAYLERENT